MKFKELEERVEKFGMLELPGQPQMMHMGTNYLVNDLFREVVKLRNLIEGALKIKSCWLPPHGTVEHANEYQALMMMHDAFKEAIGE